jgi:hypothetical protein
VVGDMASAFRQRMQRFRMRKVRNARIPTCLQWPVRVARNGLYHLGSIRAPGTRLRGGNDCAPFAFAGIGCGDDMQQS